MYRPQLLPTSAQNEQFAGVIYHLDGELVPVLTVELAPQHAIYFEHHILLWKSPSVTIGVSGPSGRRSRKRSARDALVGEAISSFVSGWGRVH